MTITMLKKLKSPHQPVGRWIRVEKRLAIYLRDNFTCKVCGADLHGADPFDITLDHFVPKAKGGSNDENNLYTCCRSCNSSRQTSELTKPQAKRVMVAMSIDLHAFKKLAQALTRDRDGYDSQMKAVRKATSRTLTCKCESCGFKTQVIGLEECPNCQEAA